MTHPLHKKHEMSVRIGETVSINVRGRVGHTIADSAVRGPQCSTPERLTIVFGYTSRYPVSRGRSVNNINNDRVYVRAKRILWTMSRRTYVKVKCGESFRIPRGSATADYYERFNFRGRFASSMWTVGIPGLRLGVSVNHSNGSRDWHCRKTHVCGYSYEYSEPRSNIVDKTRV